MAKTPQETLAALRRKIAEQKAKITEIENSPVPESEAVDQFRQRLGKLAEAGMDHLSRYARSHCWPVPTMGMLPDLRTVERDGAPYLHSAGLQNLMAAQFHDQILEVGVAEIREFYRNHPGMTVPAAKRADMLAKAKAEMFGLETEEEKLITETGLPRRPDADPAAIIVVDPGAPLPWDFRSLKANNLTVEADNARGALGGLRQSMEEVQHLLSRLEGDASGFHPDALPERLSADLTVARQDLADLKQQMIHRQDVARTLNTLSARCRQYIEDHRTPRPTNINSIRKPVNPSAQNSAK